MLGHVPRERRAHRRVLDERFELRTIETPWRPQSRDRIDLQVLELGLQPPHVVRVPHGVDHRVVEILVALPDLVAALLVVLVRDLGRHEPGRNQLGDGLLVPGKELRLVLDRVGLLPLGAELQPV